MATIVQIPAPRTRTARSDVDHDGATILFFTGVRYMRDEEPADDEADLVPVIGDPRPDGVETALSMI